MLTFEQFPEISLEHFPSEFSSEFLPSPVGRLLHYSAAVSVLRGLIFDCR